MQFVMYGGKLHYQHSRLPRTTSTHLHTHFLRPFFEILYANVQENH